jgi:hypothetical protein
MINKQTSIDNQVIMKHYNNKNNSKYIKQLMKHGFICQSPGKNGNKFFIYREGGERFMYHSGDAIIHLKQFLLKNYEYDLS